MFDEDLREQIGNNISNARKIQNKTQEEVADSIGIPRTAINKIENGKQNITGVQLIRLAKYLDIPVEMLLLNTEGL